MMDQNAPAAQGRKGPGAAGRVVTGLLKGLGGGLFLGGILFLAAGRLDWPLAWVYIGISVLDGCFLLLVLSPDLMHERSHPGAGAKSWDRLLARLTGPLGSMLLLVTAGLQVRFQGLHVLPLALQFAGLAAFVLGMGLATWAMAANNFFSLVVRIQKDRGHTVVSSGPYRFVRHPGYVGGMLFTLGTPLLLGSCWALIPAGVSAALMAVRTVLEDTTLQEELEGYREYAQRVRFRLVPGVW